MENIQVSRQKIEILISNIPDGVILLDNELKIIFINSNALQILNHKNSIQNDIQDFLPSNLLEDLFPLFLEMSQKIVVSSKKLELDFVLLNQESKKIQFLITPLIEIVSEESYFDGILLILKEVESHYIKNQFISNISHELRSPLSNIQSFIETLLELYSDLSDKQKIEFLSIANIETQRLTRLVNNILKLSKLESDYQYQFEKIHIKSMVEQILKVYQLIAQDKEIILSLEIENPTYIMMGNYDLLFQVIYNLIDNAIKFNKLHGNITIRVFAHKKPKNTNFFSRNNFNRLFRIEISDNGHGINIHRKRYLFERIDNLKNIFQSLDGIGFGLSITKNILKKHSSEIFFQTEANVGTTFWFDLEDINLVNNS
uniref:two component sensor kinase n=1 Tax=Tsunamia transpacifica TaxID=1935457 RepID=UPI001FCDB02E|nr:two component sensor kinase [Tsunamia transpacifica]UNJ14329.1 two component sensor kinase [Tsunamia transpacifica]